MRWYFRRKRLPCSPTHARASSKNTSIPNQAVDSPSSTPFALVILLHFGFVIPSGLVLMLASWPYLICIQTYYTTGCWARAVTLFRETSTLGLQLVIPLVYLCFGSYAEVFTFAKVSWIWVDFRCSPSLGSIVSTYMWW